MKSGQHGVWLFLDSSSVGGIETHVMQLASGLSSAGVDTCLVLYKAYRHSPIPELLRQLEGNTPHLTVLILDGKPGDLFQAIKGQNRPALLHTHGYKAGIIGRLTGRLLGIPVASTWHAGEVPNGIVRLYDWMDRYSAPLAQARFAVSPHIQARLPTSSVIMDNFVDVDGVAVSEGQQIAFVGRLSEEKAPDVMLELAQLCPERTFDVYGGGPMESELKASAPANLTLHGMQTHMASIWNRIGLMILPSRFEGLPMAVLEAMSRGIPVIASDVGALSSVITSGESGWLVKAADAGAIQKALSDWNAMTEQQQAAMRLACRTTIEQRFSARAIVPEFIHIYQQLAPELSMNSQVPHQHNHEA